MQTIEERENGKSYDCILAGYSGAGDCALTCRPARAVGYRNEFRRQGRKPLDRPPKAQVRFGGMWAEKFKGQTSGTVFLCQFASVHTTNEFCCAGNIHQGTDISSSMRQKCKMLLISSIYGLLICRRWCELSFYHFLLYRFQLTLKR